VVFIEILLKLGSELLPEPFWHDFIFILVLGIVLSSSIFWYSVVLSTLVFLVVSVSSDVIHSFVMSSLGAKELTTTRKKTVGPQKGAFKAQ
jgi:hypothetical protein